MKPVFLLALLTAAGLLAAAWLSRRPMTPAPTGASAPTARDEMRDDEPGDLVVSVGGMPVGEGPTDNTIRLLEGQVEYLEGQVRVLQEENEMLLHKLGTLGLPAGGAKPADAGGEVGADFVGLGIELMKLRELEALPIPPISAPAFVVEEKILAWLRSFQPADRGELFGRALHALGWIPEAVDPLPLRAALMRLQLGAWYDAGERSLFVVETEDGEAAPGSDEALGIAWAQLLREYGATLFPKERARMWSLDEQLAREAVIAGDAGLTRFLHRLRQPPAAGRDELPTEDPDHPFNQIPLPQFLRQLHFFPLNEGFEFMQSLHSLGGFAQMDASYSRPPTSTAEVLEPQRYLIAEGVEKVAISWAALEVAGQQPFWDEVLGQFACLTALRAWNDPERAGLGAQGWAGDRLLAYSAGNGRRDHAVWQTLWLDKDWAEGFFRAMRVCLQQRYQLPKAAEAEASGDLLQFEAQGRQVWMVKNRGGQGVLVLDAAAGEMAAALWKTFGETAAR